MQISEKLQTIRHHKGYSQEELARLLDVSFPTVNSWERGRSIPYPRHQRAINNLYRQVVGDHDRQLVLIVEDDAASGLVLEDYVELALPDWKAEVIDNGYDAILQIGLLQPRIVLLDIMMPQIDGIKVFQRLRENARLAEIVVIFVTATTDERLLDRARAAGAFALIQKPVKRDQMTVLLQSAAAVRA
jgi:CheY-like chemotaxis protein/DNA-binding XRE family transcriptional regulator